MIQKGAEWALDGQSNYGFQWSFILFSEISLLSGAPANPDQNWERLRFGIKAQ
jgi:hypothetical protein